MQLLAGFEVRCGDVILDLMPALQRVLAYVALAGRAVERTHTAFRLWPEKSDLRAMANLRSALWRLRQQPVTLVDISATHLRLNPAVWVDARDGIAELRRAPVRVVLSVCDRVTAPEAELLPDWYDDWILIERERLRLIRLSCLEEACRGLISESRWPAAIDLGLRILATEPLRESAHRLVIEAHLGQGNVCEAIRQLRTCQKILDEELGMSPSSDLVTLISTLTRSSRVDR